MSPMLPKIGSKSDSTGYELPIADDFGPIAEKAISSPRAIAKPPAWNGQGSVATLEDDGAKFQSRKDQPNEAYKANSVVRETTNFELAHIEPSDRKEFVIDVFRGRIVGIEHQIAIVHLTGDDGAEFSGSRQLADFKGICESVGDYFSCKTVSIGGEVKTVIGPPAKFRISEGELAKLTAELNDVYSE